MLSTSSFRRSLTSSLLVTALLAGCGGSSGGSGGSGGGANQAGVVGFDFEIAIESIGVPMTPILPTTNMAAMAFTIAPALPAGLSLDATTGTISGTPQAVTPRTSYALTADFGGGQLSVETIELEVVPTSRFLFVGTAGPAGASAGSLTRTTFDAERGELALAGIVPTGAQEQDPNEMVVDPSGRWVYVANAASDSISIHALDPNDGTLGSGAPVLLAAGSAPRSLVLEPSGAHLFVLLRGTSRIEVYDVDSQNGSLTPAPAAGAGTGAGGQTLAIDPTGSFLFCANEGDGNVSSYAIDSATGSLTEVGQRVGTGPFPQGLAAIDTGFVYVTAPTSSQVSILSFDATGALSFVDTVALGGPVPTRLAVHPGGRSLALLDQPGARVLTFSIDRATGALSATGSAAAPTGPRALRYDPSGSWLAITGFVDAELALFAVDRQTGSVTENARAAVGSRPFDVLWTRGTGPLVRFADLAFTSDATTSAVTTFTVDEPTGDLTIEANPPTAGPQPSALELDPTGRFLYSPDSQAGTVAMFRLEASSPWLTALGASPAGQPGLDALAVDPSGRFVAAASASGGGVTSFVIDQGPGAFVVGDLIPAASPFLLTGVNPSAVAYGLTGRFLYVGHAGSGPGARSIDHFGVDAQTGSLTSVPNASSTSVNGVPTDLVLHPNGRLLYAALATATGGSAEAWELGTDGNRTSVSPARATGEVSRGMAIDPRGRFLAIAVGSTSGTGDVAILALDPLTGALGAATLHPAGLQPVTLAFDPGGERLYVAGNGGDVTLCDVDPNSGALTVVSSFSAGVSVNGLVLRERQQ